MTRAVPFAWIRIVHAVLGIIVLSVYSQADSDEFGYSVVQNDIKYNNGTAELTCIVSNTTFPVQWNIIDIHGVYDPIEISNGQKLIIQDSRFSIHIHNMGLLLTIKIEDIKESDTGFYQCLVLPLNGRPLSSVKELKASHPAKIVDITIRSLVYKEGEEMILGCYATGHPKPKISWRRQNNTILSTGGLVYSGNMYTVPNITRNDRGTYYCIAENGVGTLDIRNIGIEVEFLPVVNITVPQWLVLHTDIDISCKVEAFPLPVIVWMKDDVQIINTRHYKISQVVTMDKFIISTIHVINIGRKQYGKYICQASNELGTVSDTIDMSGFKRK